MMNKKETYKIIYYSVIAFIGVVVIFLVISTFSIPGNFKVKIVQSGSMEPAIDMGSIVIVKSENNYKIGDIITFSKEIKYQEPITHRIYDIKIVGSQPHYITKGDANNTPDQREILKKDIIGKVVFHIPYIGYAVDFTKKPIGFALIIIVPAAVIIGDEIRKIYDEIKKKKEKEINE